MTIHQNQGHVNHNPHLPPTEADTVAAQAALSALGCADCNADVTIQHDAAGDTVDVLVSHDGGCPSLALLRAQQDVGCGDVACASTHPAPGGELRA